MTDTTKFPPRVCMDISVKDIAGCTGLVWVRAYHEKEFKQGEDFIYLSIAEHEAILAKHINDGYEWTRQQLNKHEEELAKLRGEIKELVEALDEMLGFHEGECRFDHHGNCQEHCCFGYDGGCDVADARQALAKHKGE